jgi:hypothetical protein
MDTLFSMLFGQDIRDRQALTPEQTEQATEALNDFFTRDLVPVQQAFGLAEGMAGPQAVMPITPEQTSNLVDVGMEALPFDDILRMLPLAQAIRFIPTGMFPSRGGRYLEAGGVMVDDEIGKVLADVSAMIDDKGAATLDVGGPGGGSLGTKGTREMTQRFVEAFPETTSVGGYRVTGARPKSLGHGENTRVNIPEPIRRRAQATVARRPPHIEQLFEDMQRAQGTVWNQHEARDLAEAAYEVGRTGGQADVWLREALGADRQVRDNMINTAWGHGPEAQVNSEVLAALARENDLPPRTYGAIEEIETRIEMREPHPEVGGAAMRADWDGQPLAWKEVLNADAMEPGRFAPWDRADSPTNAVVDMSTGEIHLLPPEQMSMVQDAWEQHRIINR